MQKIITIYDSQDLPLEVEVTANVHVENDGIGSYEFWGYKGYDKGVNYIVVDELIYDKSEYTPEQQQLIDKYFEDNWEELTELFDEIQEYERDNYDDFD